MTVDILAFGAHPDDVELAAAGTLIRAARGGATTGIITLTRGEMSSRGTPKDRAAEFDAASRILGLSHHEMLSLPDGRLTVDDASKEAVVQEIREHRPRIVLLPYGEDRHPDHPATSQIVQEAAFLAGLRKLDTGQEPHKPAALVYYMAAWEFEPSFIVDISDFIEEKRQALAAYETQLHKPAAAGPGGAAAAADSASAAPVDVGPPTFISSEHFMDMLFARMTHFGHLIGRRYGEPFRVRGYVEVKDLLDTFGDRVF
jgi:bacillithiol biosynthesis deacetylase BshB1